MRDGGRDGNVGYGRPPEATRFKKGKSGNPRGRPPKAQVPGGLATTSAADDVLRQELASVLTVTEAGKARTMTKLALITRAQINNAAKGNPLAQRDVLKAAREVERRDAARAAQEQTARETDYENVRAWKAARARLWGKHVAIGQEPANPWPHPDDILLDPVALSFRVRGPLNEDCLPRYEYYRAQRDFLLVHCLLDWRLKKRISPLGAMWGEFDRLLPRRWQLEFCYHGVAGCFLSLPLRELRELRDNYERRVLQAELEAGIAPLTDAEHRAVWWVWGKIQSGELRAAFMAYVAQHSVEA